MNEHKNPEERLIESKKYLDNIINALGDPIFVKDHESHLLLVNDAFCAIFNTSREKIIGKTLAEDVPQNEQDTFLRIDKEVISTGIENVNEETLTVRNGKTRIISTKKTRFIDDKGNKFLIGVIRDITERKKAEKLIIQKNEILNLISNNASLKKVFNHLLLSYESNHPEYYGAISLLDEDGIHLNLAAAPSMPKAYNLAITKGVIGKSAGSCGTAAFTKKPVIVSDISTDKLWVDYRDVALKHNLKSCWSVPILSKSNDVLGTFAIYSGSINSPSEEEIAELDFAVNLAHIAIEKVRSALEIKKKDESYKALVDQANDAIMTYSLDGSIHSYNKSCYINLGYTKKEFSKLKLQDLIAGEIVQDLDNKKKLIKGEAIVFSRKFIHKDKSIIDVEISAKLQKDGKILGIARNVTERKKADLELKLAKEFTDKLVMSMQEGLIIVNPEGEIIMINDSTCNILGYSRSELIGMELPYPFARTEDFEEISKTNEKVKKGEAPTFKFEFIRKNGEHFLASFLTGNIKNDKGEVIALFGTIKDISKEEKAKKVLEENAKKSNQKKKVILELAGLVGEDFTTSLGKITKLSAETLNVERVSVWSFNDDKSEIYCEKLYASEMDEYEIGVVLKHDDNPQYFKALEKSQTILITDVKKDNVTKQFAKNYLIPNNIQSLMDVFINSTDGYYGIICFEHVGSTTKTWSADEQEFAISIASIVSLMVESKERKIAEDELVIINEELKNTLNEINELKAQLEQENVYLRNELDLVFNYEEMVYGSAEFSMVLTEVEKVAPTTATVLLLGESGTGKELLARAIHNISLRNKKPLIKVNCSAIPRELIESELFGHKKGSFTGAFSDKVGKFELADGGTLFLDEIGELPLDMQPKILRFLQEGEIEVVGGVGSTKLNVRVIAATNRNLKEEIEKKRFREDLFFRLNVFPIEVPPLRKRTDDIPLLVEHFVDKFNKAYGKNIKFITDEAMSKLKVYDWPGNIRELENLIERASILSTSNTLVIPGFESSLQKAKSLNEKDLSLEAVQRHHILQVLEQCNWKISGPQGASTLLNLKPSTLRDKMTKLNIFKT